MKPLESQRGRASLTLSALRSPAASSRRGSLTRAKVERWIVVALERLSLSLWIVKLSEEPADQDAWADIEPHSQAYTATLRLSHDFWKQERSRQREILTHEILHLATYPYDRMVHNMEEPIGKIGWAAFEPQLEDASERVVDYFARIIAPMMPPLK